MKLSTKFLKNLIKEELENFLSDEETEEEVEQEPAKGGFKFKLDPQAAQAAIEDGFKLDKSKK